MSLLSRWRYLRVPSKPMPTDPSALRINEMGWVDSPMISPSGLTLWFMYSRYNFFPFIKSGAHPRLEGPARIGHHNNDLNPWADADIYFSRRNHVGAPWGTPVNWPGNTGLGNASMMIAEELALEPSMYSIMEAGPNTTVVCKQTQKNGTWSDPVPCWPATPGTIEDNPHIYPGQGVCVYTSNRPGGYGGRDLWIRFRGDGGTWGEPHNLGPTINTSGDEDHFFLGRDGTAMFTRHNSQIFQTRWDATSGFSAPREISLLDEGGRAIIHKGEPSMPEDGSELYFFSADPVSERVMIRCAKRLDEDRWGPAMPVD